MDYAVIVIFLIAIGAFTFGVRQKQKELDENQVAEEILDLTDVVDDEVIEVVAKKQKSCRCITQNVFGRRNGQRARIGVLVSCIKDNKVRIGFSLCNKTDQFDVKEAYNLASSRMGDKEVVVPHSLKKDLHTFSERCSRYYKGASIATFDGTKIVNG